MNRIQERDFSRNIKRLKRIEKNKTKGAFGELPMYLKRKKLKKNIPNIVSNDK
jgi:hypothetical protein